MKTQQALLSTTMMCPFRSTDTPLGPMSFPEPIFDCRLKVKKLKRFQSPRLNNCITPQWTSLPWTSHRLRRCWPICCRSQRWWCRHWDGPPHRLAAAVARETALLPQTDSWRALHWWISVHRQREILIWYFKIQWLESLWSTQLLFWTIFKLTYLNNIAFPTIDTAIPE